MNAPRFEQFENLEHTADGVWLCGSEAGSIVKNHYRSGRWDEMARSPVAIDRTLNVHVGILLLTMITSDIPGTRLSPARETAESGA